MDITYDNDLHKTKFVFIADWRHGTEMQTLVKGNWWVRQRQPTTWNCHLDPSLRYSGSSNHCDPSIFGTRLTGEVVAFNIIALGYATQRPRFVFTSAGCGCHRRPRESLSKPSLSTVLVICVQFTLLSQHR